VKASFGFGEEDWSYIVCLIVLFVNVYIYNLNTATSSKMNIVEVDGCEEDEDDAKDSDLYVFDSN